MFKHKILSTCLVLVLSQTGMASNYTLPMSELFQSCSFIHTDSYSLNSITSAIKSSLQSKLDADTECNASFNQLNTSFNTINSMMDRTVTPGMAQNIYNETYSNYLVNLTQEASLLNQSDSNQMARYNTLISQIDSLKAQLYGNAYNLELNKEIYGDEISTDFKKNMFHYSRDLFTALNNTPDKCINRIGGWSQVVPAILKVASVIGSTMGPTGMVVGAGLEAASELSVLLQNTRLKKAIANINRRENEQILACTYLSLQTTACDLKRAKDFSENKEKVKEIIFRNNENSKYKEYEDFYIALNLLPRINNMLTSIGAMGSAVTLDVQLITKYFEAVRIRPDEITEYPTSGSDEEIQKFLLQMKSRGIMISEFTMNGQPIPLAEQLASVKTTIDMAKSTINSVINILLETRSFIDLHGELTKNSANVKNEISYLRTFLVRNKEREDFPVQYLGLFHSADSMISALENFLGVTMDGRNYAEFLEEVNSKGRDLFTAMSYGSVAQITNQTVLMIPAIAFERFARPFKALENYYLNRDILRRDDSSHVSFTDYMMNEALQVKIIQDYKYLTGSKVSFRLEKYETTKRSFEKGFKREIKRMIKNAMKAESEVLSSMEGKTAAQMCALFSPFLKEHSSRLFKKCQENYKSLELLSVLDDFKKRTTMNIDYENACFYSDYTREEVGQRMLFDRLIDYGFAKNYRY